MPAIVRSMVSGPTTTGAGVANSAAGIRSGVRERHASPGWFKRYAMSFTVSIPASFPLSMTGTREIRCFAMRSLAYATESRPETTKTGMLIASRAARYLEGMTLTFPRRPLQGQIP